MRPAVHSWPEVSLGEICELKYGKSLPEAARIQGTVPVYGSNGLVGRHNQALTAGATIVIGRKGSLGEIHSSDIACWPIDTTYFIDQSATKADLRWLGHQLVALELTKLNKAAAIPGLNRDDAYRKRLLLPPLQDQQRIATILDAAQVLRARRRAALAQITVLARSIFSETLNNSKHTRYQRVPLPDAYWFQEGPGVRKWQFKSEGVKLLNVGNIEKDGTLNLIKTSRHIAHDEATGKYSHFLADAGDLVIASSGISFDADGMLRTRGAFVSANDLPLCMNTSTIRFKAIKATSDLHFLHAWLDSTDFRAQITKLVTGTAQQNFGPTHLASLTITLPPLEIQREFARRVAAVERLKSTHRAHLAELDALFASLQHRAFRGEL